MRKAFGMNFANSETNAHSQGVIVWGIMRLSGAGGRYDIRWLAKFAWLRCRWRIGSMSMSGPSVYKSILAVREARWFDFAGFCMRFYGYMMNIGTVSMLTLAGYSILTAGFVSSVIAFMVFVVSPRVGKLVDERGQHRVVPIAAAITLLGLAGLLTTAQLHGPEPLLYLFAVFMGFLPSAQALVRSRWTYLLRTGKLGDDAPDIRTIFSYEGVIDDIGFMLGPPASIAIAAAVTPIAGLTTGGILFAVGAVIMTLSRATEPVPGWEAAEGEAASAVSPAPAAKPKSIIRERPIVRVLFALMFFVGALYGIFDTTGVAFAEEVGNPNIAGIALMASGFISIVVGFVFGMVHIRIAPYKQVVLFASLIGLAYGWLMLVADVPSFFIVSFAGALFYAPCLITVNAACERAVPGKRLTESITWINAGSTLGLAVGPSVAGMVVATWGSLMAFDLGGIIAILVPVTALLCFRIIKRDVRADSYEVISSSPSK